MTDIAVDKGGNVYAVSQVAAYPLTITGNTVHCAATWTLPSQNVFYGLTFAPENTVAAAETLVAADSGGKIWSIDSQGKTVGLGNFGKDTKGDVYELSGDIVFLANNGTPVGFATVRTCPNGTCATVDTLVEIDVTKLKPNNTTSAVKSVRGVLHKAASCTNSTTAPSYGKMYGIAAFEDQVYGFSHDTGIVAINNVDASVCLDRGAERNLVVGRGRDDHRAGHCAAELNPADDEVEAALVECVVLLRQEEALHALDVRVLVAGGRETRPTARRGSRRCSSSRGCGRASRRARA